ncbi:MAG: hypothetical protein ACRERV_10220, partial [Methylococcales bacterium]
ISRRPDPAADIRVPVNLRLHRIVHLPRVHFRATRHFPSTVSKAEPEVNQAWLHQRNHPLY